MNVLEPVREERLLKLSVWGAIVFAVLAVAWGLLAGSKMILFDGLYSSISVGLSTLSLAAFRAVQRGPDESYHYGRDAMLSLTIVVKGVAIGALCLYALAGGVLDLLAGGREVALGSATAYAAVAAVGCGAMTLVLRRGAASGGQAGDQQGGTDLLGAEAAQWLLDALLSLVVLAGFLGALVLVGQGREDLAAYVDPLLVSLMSAIFLVLPVRLIRSGLRGTLAAAPDVEVQQAMQGAVDSVVAAHGFAASSLRVATFGERYDVAVGLLAGPDTSVDGLAGADRIRAELHDALAALGHDLLVSVSITADARWLA